MIPVQGVCDVLFQLNGLACNPRSNSTFVKARRGSVLEQDGLPFAAVFPLTPCGHLPILKDSHISSGLKFCLEILELFSL